jgi:hypothetical protein
MLINKTSAIAKANKLVVYSKVILYSPRSLLSVPSMSNTRILLEVFIAIQIPFVVYVRPSSVSMTSNFVPNKRFNNVPIDRL